MKNSILLFAFLLLSANCFANLNLVCEWKTTTNLKSGEISATSGSGSYHITELKNKEVVIKKDGLSANFSGFMNDAEISGNVTYKMPGLEKPVYETIRINRYTGVIEATYSIGQEDQGLLHIGSCSQSSKKF